MKKLIPIICCLLLLSCKEEPIPVVTAQMLPTEMTYLGPDTLFDTIPYQIVDIIRDTITPDSIVIDTLITDTFRLDTFYLDSVRFTGTLSYEGNKPYGPALHEYGFCVGDRVYYPVATSSDLQTPVAVYDTFTYALQVRNTDAFYVHVYAVNPFGIIRSAVQKVTVSNFDPR